MKVIAVSKFKATCLSLLETVLRTGQPILITKQGKPLAQILPPPPVENKGSWLGVCAGTAKISQDLIAPASDLNDWEALKK